MLYLLEAYHHLLKIFCMGYTAWSDGRVSLNSLRNKCYSTWGRWLGDPKDLKRKKGSSKTRADIGKVNWERQKASRIAEWDCDPKGDVNTCKETACYSCKVDQQWKLEKACNLMLQRHTNTVGKTLGILTSQFLWNDNHYCKLKISSWYLNLMPINIKFIKAPHLLLTKRSSIT